MVTRCYRTTILNGADPDFFDSYHPDNQFSGSDMAMNPLHPFDASIIYRNIVIVLVQLYGLIIVL